MNENLTWIDHNDIVKRVIKRETWSDYIPIIIQNLSYFKWLNIQSMLTILTHIGKLHAEKDDYIKKWKESKYYPEEINKSLKKMAKRTEKCAGYIKK
jgi:hypothetical protein